MEQISKLILLRRLIFVNIFTLLFIFGTIAEILLEKYSYPKNDIGMFILIITGFLIIAIPNTWITKQSLMLVELRIKQLKRLRTVFPDIEMQESNTQESNINTNSNN